MIIILNIDSEKFSLNGIPYFKNFMPHVLAGKLKIVNVYDTVFELAVLDHFYNFSVDGIIYESVSDLQNSLLPVIYSRNSLGSSFFITPPITYLELRWVAHGVGHVNPLVEEPGDIFEGWKDATTYWTRARWNGGDRSDRNNYTPIVENSDF